MPATASCSARSRSARGALALDAAAPTRSRGTLRELRADAAAAWRELEFAGSLQARLDGVGVLDARGRAAARRGRPGGARGGRPRATCAARARASAYDGFTPGRAADADRRRRRPAASCARSSSRPPATLLDELLAGPLARGSATPRATAATALGVGRVESPRGATICAVELDGGRVARLHLRTGSYANWPALAHATAGNLLPDFPLINKSFELCYACVDR